MDIRGGIIVEDVDPRCISRGLQFDEHSIVRISAVGTRHINLLFRLTEGKGRRCIGYVGRFDERLRAGEWYDFGQSVLFGLGGDEMPVSQVLGSCNNRSSF